MTWHHICTTNLSGYGTDRPASCPPPVWVSVTSVGNARVDAKLHDENEDSK